MPGKALAERFLAHMGLSVERPSVDYLHRIVGSHQRSVVWETATKIIDAEERAAAALPLPEVGEYIERIVGRGAGGTCWTHARGLRWLLSELGFDAAYMYMDPGHLCVRVELDGCWYADVGYGAPLFRAYPLMESFTVSHPQERFEYRVREGDVLVTREPGPVKTLDPTPRRFEEFTLRIVDANTWRERSFLTRLDVHGYVGGASMRLSENRLRRWDGGGMTEEMLDEDGIRRLLREGFGMDPELYFRAREIRAARMAEHGLALHQPSQAVPNPA
jgi:arylamine N-acetyltransferase